MPLLASEGITRRTTECTHELTMAGHPLLNCYIVRRELEERQTVP